MSQISTNFILRSKLPNFERDSFANVDEMRLVESSWMDEGHISYCRADGKHYVFKSKDEYGNDLTGMERWTLFDVSKEIKKEYIYTVDDVNNLTCAFASSIPVGSLVYVKNTADYYINTYDISLNREEQQEISTYDELGAGWFKLLTTELYIKKILSDLQIDPSKYDLIADTNGDNFGLVKLSDHFELGSDSTNLNQLFINTKTFATKDYVEGKHYLQTQDISHLVTNENLTATIGSVYSDIETNKADILSIITNNYLEKGSIPEAKPGLNEFGLVKLSDHFVLGSDPNNPNQLLVNEDVFATKEQFEKVKTDLGDIEVNLGSAQQDIVVLKDSQSNFVAKEQFEKVKNDLSDIELNLGSAQQDIVALKDSQSNFVAKEYLEDNYINRDEIPNIEDLSSIEQQIKTVSVAAATIQDDLNEYKKEVDKDYAKKTDLNDYVKYKTFQTENAATISRIVDVEELANEVDYKTDNIIATYVPNEEFNRYKEEVENTYAKPEDISSKLNTYAPSTNHENRWIGSEYTGMLSGKTGKEIANSAYSYSAVFDQMLFGEFTPTISQPSVEVRLKGIWNNGLAVDWYDKENRIILVEHGAVGPDGGDFEAVNVKDAIISYPKGIDLSNKFTNGLIPATDEKHTSIGFCRVKDENGDWIYYRKENNIYHVPSILEAGEYRYYMAAYFQKDSPALNNDGMTIAEWNENIAVESEDYITIIASKPTYYNTKTGFIKNPVVLWGEEMIDYMVLKPSCQVEQAFKLPKKLKGLYIWNDIAGDYAMVPMVYQKDENGLPTENLIPAYFNESVDENNYYTYTYNSEKNGHRGEIKIKVIF